MFISHEPKVFLLSLIKNILDVNPNSSANKSIVKLLSLISSSNLCSFIKIIAS